jgi:hypothetical protein
MNWVLKRVCRPVQPWLCGPLSYSSPSEAGSVRERGCCCALHWNGDIFEKRMAIEVDREPRQETQHGYVSTYAYISASALANEVLVVPHIRSYKSISSKV